MTRSRISRTAAYVAAARAVGAREPDAAACNPDHLAEQLLGDVKRYDLDLPIIHALAQSYDDAMTDLEVAATVAAMIVRARFVDEALERAVDAGAKQLLILGAGFDSHAYRFRRELRAVAVYEVDHPATQAWKRERVAAVVGNPPPNLRYVAVDFAEEDLATALRRQGYDFSLRSFVIMEGVTMYLEEAALKATLRLIATHPAGSSVVLDFVSSVMLGMIRAINPAGMPPTARAFAERFLHLTRDEPWQFGFPFRQEREFLEALGLSPGEMLAIGSEDAARRYLTRGDGTRVGGDIRARMPTPPTAEAREQAEAMTYRIAEAFVPLRH